MPPSYMGRSARSLNQSAYSAGTAASTGRVVRQSPPPKFHPFIIIAVVITVGIVIVGLVMTVIAYWPGYSAIGFNAMRIVGPVILGVGGLALICTISVVVMRNKYQREEWQQKMLDHERSRVMYASRTTFEQPVTPTSTYSKPSRSILKKTESTSTYGRDSNVFEEGSDSGIPHTNNISYEPDSDSEGRRKHPVYKIETMPDPHAARNGAYPGSQQYPGYQPRNQHPSMGSAGRGLNSSTESESNVPVPIRVPNKSKKRTPSKQQPQYEAEAYATQEPPLARGSPLVGTPDLGYMGDRLSYTSDGAEPMESPPPKLTDQQPRMQGDPQPKARRQLQSYENTGYDAFADPTSQPSGEPKKQKRKKQSQNQPLEGEPGDLDNVGGERKSHKKKKKKRAPAEPTAADPQLTRININAQPGTSVQITPGATYAQVQPREKKSSVGSVETEI